MKIYWHRIPECFTHVTSHVETTSTCYDDRVSLIVLAHTECPRYCRETKAWLDGGHQRRLLPGVEFELDPKEVWQESVEQRPFEVEVCPTCNGRGEVRSSWGYENKSFDEVIKCQQCGGTGAPT